MTIKANCKINIGLDVLERRADGFHSLSTVMIPVVGLYDVIDVEAIDGCEVEFASKGMVVDCAPEHNLCIKAYNLLKAHFPSISAVRITLDKRVPFGAGLGGGSSDATAVIVALNSLFSLELSEEQLIEFAAQLGSDTAFFVRNNPQICTGRGEVMSPVKLDLNGKYLVLIKPDVSVSTREAYAGVTPQYPTIPLSELIELPLEQWQGKIKNDFEPHIFRAHPLLGQVKSTLLDAGAIYAAMSGSGSTIYGIFDKKEPTADNSLKEYSPYVLEL
ncbi:MAG: 4-(cytidine 5'-diphospho)-2-C-methyl-D-erythritol kinase [Rikenellaceae bacterium]